MGRGRTFRAPPAIVSFHGTLLTSHLSVGESEKRGETSVTVTGLNPDQRYNVRVIAANAQNFQAPGQLIRLRTCAKNRDSTEPPSTGHRLEEDAPSVHSTSAAEVPPSPHHVERAHHPQQRRGTKDRRASPATEMQQHVQGYSPEDQHSVDTLTRDLEVVRKEIMETEAQLQHAEEEYKAVEAVLRQELDGLKDKKNEEDAGRQRIRVETKSLEEARRTAEALRTRTEKSLRAKEYEVKRMQDDISRWEEEKLAAIGKVEELAKSAEKSKASVAVTEKEMSNDIQETQKQIVEMEDEIRTLVATMKSLETQKEQLKAEEDEEAQKLKEYEQRESAWNERHMKLEMDYCSVYQAYKAVSTALFTTIRTQLIIRRLRWNFTILKKH
jgi:phage shock protein A